MYDIIIPSCKAYEDMHLHAQLLRSKDPEGSDYNYIITSFNASASVNRNYGLYRSFRSPNEYIIMIDDDIGGFYSGWQNDLCSPLKENRDVAISSARLITPEGLLSPMMGADSRIDKKLSSVDKAVLSAAIAFRKSDVINNISLRFCMTMIGSGWEDTLFCRLMTKAYPESRFVVVNGCRLIHYHEMKKQSENFTYNHKIYASELQKAGLHE